MSERTIYRETYRKGLKLNDDVLPILQHMSDKGEHLRATECHLLAAGMISRDGQELEYADLRVFFVKDPA